MKYHSSFNDHVSSFAHSNIPSIYGPVITHVDHIFKKVYRIVSNWTVFSTVYSIWNKYCLQVKFSIVVLTEPTISDLPQIVVSPELV